MNSEELTVEIPLCNYDLVPSTQACDVKSSLELAIENDKELIEYFKDTWTKEEYDRQLKFLEQSKYNLSIWENA